MEAKSYLWLRDNQANDQTQKGCVAYTYTERGRGGREEERKGVKGRGRGE